MVHTMPDGTVMRDVDMPAMAGQGLLAVSEDLHGKHQVEAQLVQQFAQHPVVVEEEPKVHTMPDGSTMLDTDMPVYETKHAPGMHMMQDGSWMKDEEMVHTMPDGTVMRDVDMPAMAGQGLLAVSEDLHGKHQVEAQLVQQFAQHPVVVEEEPKVHTMPDGSTMLDTDMPVYEMKHSPGMHMMQDGSWMKDEEMVHTMPDGTVMRDVDMPAMARQGLLAVSEDLHGKHQAESAHTHSAPRLLSEDLLLEYRKLRSQYHDAVKAGVHGDLRHALSAQYHLLESKV